MLWRWCGGRSRLWRCWGGYRREGSNQGLLQSCFPRSHFFWSMTLPSNLLYRRDTRPPHSKVEGAAVTFAFPCRCLWALGPSKSLFSSDPIHSGGQCVLATPPQRRNAPPGQGGPPLGWVWRWRGFWHDTWRQGNGPHPVRRVPFPGFAGSSPCPPPTAGPLSRRWRCGTRRPGPAACRRWGGRGLRRHPRQRQDQGRRPGVFGTMVSTRPQGDCIIFL